ncbi:hypothetical protein XBO1_480070 [Xenorhabdus bovienii str. oregonense]|uniref:Uncharacterized protein n=1 Tax=Xenorhabdus bovienii str. oregonense TaxID=1398202 RepID=A0A077P9G0_XENBV|nr:hypothetical protein XBO1_480070 [Xenorhabdus bovienii str. oregonense]
MDLCVYARSYNQTWTDKFLFSVTNKSPRIPWRIFLSIKIDTNYPASLFRQ